MPQDTDKYTDDETRRRFEAALKGARIAGPMHKESVPPKSDKKRPKKRKKAK